MNSDSHTGDNTVARILHLARESVPPVHPAGRPFVIGALAAALLLRRIATPLGTAGVLAAGALAWFFREPNRVAPANPHLAVAPADGTVTAVEEATPPAELGTGQQPRTRISIFLSVLDVHVQRLPATGTVERVAYRAGKFLSADLDKASEANERNSLLLRTEDGHRLTVVQIAGLVARRIVCDVTEGDAGRVGSTYGLIRFGSRVDIYLPHGSHVLVTVGQRAIGGETPLAALPSAPGTAQPPASTAGS
ncbi:phosphatidylserine decarboxylase [Haloechinothrix sp. YIM 98757]|uniref:Phosphatidylserine decarboxylase proenzyme n=1 Tax=Haloechinothrix aidingensis TaxID=2752311 RepID=A0A838AEZ0_9PSEU|nr:phosphatidylserine decarboxylase [Haloechinothrix aidingensis]MBA0127727.1 phosphatidylserine decarboxylase [Haloechinothrix aidingensis]